MTGAEFLTYLKRRLAENGVAADPERDAELLDYGTEGRDALLQTFADAAPIVVKTLVTLEVDDDDDRLYAFPSDTADPYRVLRLTDSACDRELEPSSSLNNDAGEYAWATLRQVKLARCVTLQGSLVAEVVLAAGAITVDTTEAEIGLPTTCHRAAAKLGVVLALTADEESDASVAMGLFQRELDILEKLYGDYDANSGGALRFALMRSIGALYGDSLS